MRIVLDTNVLVSAGLNPQGSPGRCLDLILAGEAHLLLDDRIVAEYREVLLRPRFDFAPSDVHALLAYLTRAGEPISAKPLGLSLPDPADLPFLEVAVAGGAEALVTGNLRHFPAEKTPEGLRILRPAEFLARLAP